MILTVLNVLAIALGFGLALLPKDSPLGGRLRVALSRSAVTAILVSVYVLAFISMRSGGQDRSTTGLVADLVAASTIALGPLYVGAIGTFVAKWWRSALATQTVFCAVTLIASVILLFGSWYMGRR
jgi:hypothetical protein